MVVMYTLFCPMVSLSFELTALYMRAQHKTLKALRHFVVAFDGFINIMFIIHYQQQTKTVSKRPGKNI